MREQIKGRVGGWWERKKGEGKDEDMGKTREKERWDTGENEMSYISPHNATGLTTASSSAQFEWTPSFRGIKWNTVDKWGEMKVGWWVSGWVGGNERRKLEKGRCYKGFQERMRK